MDVKVIKEIGWDFISVGAKKFDGAVQNFKADNGSTVAVGFNFHEAFIIEDEEGLFTQNDIVHAVIMNSAVDIKDINSVEGASVLADNFDEDEISFDEDKLISLGINDFSIKESISKRLALLSTMDGLEDIPL